MGYELYLERLTGEDDEPYSFSGDEDDAGQVITQHRYYRFGDGFILAIGELNYPNNWNDDAFDAACAALEAAFAKPEARP